MRFRPPSLAQLFNPPADCRGVFGWLCGYSADSSFLNDAVERFSGLTHGQRAYQGQAYLAMMLDPGNKPITPKDVPGALHLPVTTTKLPFVLLHAKIAILGFRGPDGPVVRLIVSTGNWTSQTLEESLDLAWHIDVRPVLDMDQNRADLAAASDFMGWLQGLFDQRLLETAPTRESVAWLKDQIAALGQPDVSGHLRFIENRNVSFLDQLPDLIAKNAGKRRRNTLYLGSGFFEQPKSVKASMVPDRIQARLKVAGLLTKSCKKFIYVNPLACHGIATTQKAVAGRGWNIRAAAKPPYFGEAARGLHAKFIFSMSQGKDENTCSDAWVYLGSGNLTQQGFVRKAGKGGNLEAGVVFSPGPLRWTGAKSGSDAASVVTNLLPISKDDDNVPELPALMPGDGMPDRGTLFIAPPVAFFIWDDAGYLIPDTLPQTAFTLLGRDNEACLLLSDGRFEWKDRPRQVTVTWLPGDLSPRATASVPVIDKHGRLCATDLPELELEDAWLHLFSFPEPPDDDNDAEDTDSYFHDGVADKNIGGLSQKTKVATYPVREMMIVIENIAARQIRLSEVDWPTWCMRLEQVLFQAKDCDVAHEFRQIGINPFCALLAKEFRPKFAADDTTEAGKIYVSAIDAVISAWGLSQLSRLGDHE